MAENTMESAGPAASAYDRLGGTAGIREAVERFYTALLDDDELAGYFDGVDMARLKRHQVLLLSQVLGGPEAYDGRDLGEAHQGLGITPRHYYKVVGHLVEVLTQLGATDDIIDAAGQVLQGVMPQIVEVDDAGQSGATDSSEPPDMPQ